MAINLLSSGVCVLIVNSLVFIILCNANVFHWKDCASNPRTAAFTFNSFRVWPVPAILPGDLHFSADITVNKPIHKLYIDDEMDEVISEYMFKLPCLGQGFGSCSDIDSCRFDEVDLPDIWKKFMFYLLANASTCPIQSKSVLIQDEIISIPPMPQAIQLLIDKNFTIKLHFKDDPSSSEHIGCLQFDFELEVQGSPQALVGRRVSDEDLVFNTT